MLKFANRCELFRCSSHSSVSNEHVWSYLCLSVWRIFTMWAGDLHDWGHCWNTLAQQCEERSLLDNNYLGSHQFKNGLRHNNDLRSH
jgi:hypothetical protein